MLKSLSAIAMIVFIFSGCDYKYKDPCKKAPTISAEDLREHYPKVTAPKKIEKAAKIYNYKDGDILLINEKNRGIHLIDNRNPQNPINLNFIEIPGNIDMAVKGNYLYVDSFTDLVVLDIHDLHDIKTVYRKEDIFPYNRRQAIDDMQNNSNECYRYDAGIESGFYIWFN